MTAKDNSFNVRIDDETHTAIKNAISKSQFKSKKDLLETLINFLPVYHAIKDKGLDMNTAIAKINGETVKTEIRIIKKGLNDMEFEKWLNKLFKYNESVNNADRVFITQNLFLDIIGGNVTKLSALYRENETLIKDHNERMGKVLSDNRKMINRVKTEGFQNLAEWVKAKAG